MAKLEPLIPSTSPIDWRTTVAVAWMKDGQLGRFFPIDNFHRIELDDLLQVDRQKKALTENTYQFCKKLPANNALLWGARGTGKSSLIHALLNRFANEGLRLIELQKSDFGDFSKIVQSIKDLPFRFLIVCDDLSFERSDSSYKELKSILEGSVAATSDNILIYATSNRRHLVSESTQDNAGFAYEDGELHASEAVEEKISLSDRFGLWLSFYAFKQDEYLEVVIHWLNRLAQEHGCEFFELDSVKDEALRWALNRGARNGRTAYYFARNHIGHSLAEKLKD